MIHIGFPIAGAVNPLLPHLTHVNKACLFSEETGQKDFGDGQIVQAHPTILYYLWQTSVPRHKIPTSLKIPAWGDDFFPDNNLPGSSSSFVV